MVPDKRYLEKWAVDKTKSYILIAKCNHYDYI